jgi:hypothetical protein
VKKFIIALLGLAIVGGAGYFLYEGSVPKSERLQAKYKKFTDSLDQSQYATDQSYRERINQELHDRQEALAVVYINEQKPDEAIIFLETLIRSMNGPHYVHGRQAPRNSGQAGLVAKYYTLLSDAYGMKYDEKKRAWALNMSMHYEAEAEQLRKRE